MALDRPKENNFNFIKSHEKQFTDSHNLLNIIQMSKIYRSFYAKIANVIDGRSWKVSAGLVSFSFSVF